MARFTFNLQVVLEQREREEQFAERDHAQSLQAVRRLEDQLAAIESELKQNNEAMRDHHLVGKLDLSLLAAHRRYLIAMRASVIAVAQKIAQARLAAEATQRKLTEAAKARKAIEVLRDRQKARWSAEQERKELAIADDVGMQIAYQDLARHYAAPGGGSAA